MCLAVPMRILRFLDAETAVAQRAGLELNVNVTLVEGIRVGDYVVVHAGFAISTMDPGDAEELSRLLLPSAETG